MTLSISKQAENPTFYRSNTEPQEDILGPHHYQGASGLHNGDTVFEHKANQDDDDNDIDDGI